MKQPTKPHAAQRKPKPQRYALDISKWIVLALLAEKYGFELREQPERKTRRKP